MIDPNVRPADHHDADDVAQLELLESEARASLVGQRGGERWLIEHPEIGEQWVDRCGTDDVWVGHMGDVVVGYMVALLGLDSIIRVDQVWSPPKLENSGSVMRCSLLQLRAPTSAAPWPWKAKPCPVTDTRRTSTSGPVSSLG